MEQAKHNTNSVSAAPGPASQRDSHHPGTAEGTLRLRGGNSSTPFSKACGNPQGTLIKTK